MGLIVLLKKIKADKRRKRIEEITRACTDALENGYHYYNKHLALKICFLMLKNHIPRELLATAIGVSDEDMDRILSGQLIIHPDMLKQIAIVLGTTKKELLRMDIEEV